MSHRIPLVVAVFVGGVSAIDALRPLVGGLGGWLPPLVFFTLGGLAGLVDFLCVYDPDEEKQRQNKGSDATAEIDRQIAALMTVKERLKEGK